MIAVLLAAPVAALAVFAGGGALSHCAEVRRHRSERSREEWWCATPRTSEEILQECIAEQYFSPLRLLLKNAPRRTG